MLTIYTTHVCRLKCFVLHLLSFVFYTYKLCFGREKKVRSRSGGIEGGGWGCEKLLTNPKAWEEEAGVRCEEEEKQWPTPHLHAVLLLGLHHPQELPHQIVRRLLLQQVNNERCL